MKREEDKVTELNAKLKGIKLAKEIMGEKNAVNGDTRLLMSWEDGYNDCAKEVNQRIEKELEG